MAALGALLETLLAQALQETGFPVAALNLALHGLQASAARGALAQDASGERTQRAYAFCRCVGVGGAPLWVHDTLEQAGLPAALTLRHGVRAYAGIPLWVHGALAGTLAVVDAQPRRLAEPERRALEALALTAARRLEMLASR
ncbi:MAG TPA: GAF domain-containing protein [Aggregicoccus sp.]|nr:GAF domain-containing protein [Aggregicoccus sp.]